jgi:hypothetical protein
MVRIRRCRAPLSPTACRAAVILLLTVESETIRPTPHFRQQVFLADDAPTVTNEEGQQVEDLWFDRHRVGSTPQFPQVRIERKLVKQVDQVSASRTTAGRQPQKVSEISGKKQG